MAGWKRARARAGKVAGVAIAALACVELGWLVIANCVLGFQLPTRLVGQSGAVKLGYSRAWSAYPGDLRVRGFWVSVRAASGHRVDIDAARAHAGVDLVALLRR